METEKEINDLKKRVSELEKEKGKPKDNYIDLRGKESKEDDENLSFGTGLPDADEYNKRLEKSIGL